MKIKLIYPLMIFAALGINVSFSQEIYSVDPNHGFAGQDGIPVTIICTGINSIDEYEDVVFDSPDITVHNNWEAVNNARLDILIGISPGASEQKTGVTIYLSENRQIYKSNVFEIKATGNLNVFLTVIPTDPLYLSSFNPDDPQNSPLLFLVNLNNDSITFDLTVKFTVKSSDYGEIAFARKYFLPSNINTTESFDNREFDEYEISSTAGGLLDEAMQTGLLPPGTYEYIITLHPYGNEQVVLGGDVGYNEVTNLITSIDLIGPGNSLDYTPEVIYFPNPYFQWFSMANSYDFTLYEVMEGQTVPDEITTNLPEYEELNYGMTELLYPTYAELLEIGKTYAWQVKAYFEGSMGQETVYSDLFWFTYQQGGNNIIDHIEVIPDEVTLNTGESYQFYAVGFDTNGDTVQVDCDWQVVPGTGGLIDDDGLFVAGGNPATVALLAHIESIEEYATITITYKTVDTKHKSIIELIMNILGAQKSQP